jgi:glycosyltransferase involved in cell wall biosynthesis
MTPRLSVVTACYNHGHFLAECMASVQSQTEQNIEHIIVIDGATDNSGLIASDGAARDGRVRVFSHMPNRGLAASQNRGIREARGEWVLKVDADDKIDARYVEVILRAAESDPARNVIFAPAKHFGNRTDVWVYPQFNASRMIETFMIPGPAGFRKSLWEAVGGYDETMKSAEDWDFYIRAHLAVGLVPHQIMLPGVYWWYRVHDGARASASGIAKLPELQRYWRGHTRESVLAGSRSWGQWCAEREGLFARTA